MQEKRIEMRIIGGEYRHRKILWPKDTSIRPTKDRIRESIFNALSNIEGKVFLDLYAGSGAMGIEALSRGAGFSYFVDINPSAISCVKENLKSLSIDSNRFHILYEKDIDALKYFRDNNIKFDIVFLDPPYKKGEYGYVVNLLFEYDLLNESAIVITESEPDIRLIETFSKHRNYKYGNIFINIYWR